MSEISRDSFNRFSRSERIQHVLLLITVTLLALTGLPQKFSSTAWAPSMLKMFGGIYAARVIHRICAFALTAGVIYHVIYGLYRLATKRARFDMLPRGKDLKDLIGNFAYFLGIQKERPRFERFNYIEKFEYWAVLWGMGVMTITGLILWFPSIVARIMPGIAIPAARAAHSGEAFLAVTAVVIWHMYNAHLSPRVFPINLSIFNGKISKHEMMTEHAQEYERLTGEEVPGEVLAKRSPVSWYVLLTSGMVGVVLVGMFVFLWYWSVHPPSPVLPSPINPHLERDSVFLSEQTLGESPTVFWSGSHTAPETDFTVLLATGAENVSPQTFQFKDQSIGQVTSWWWDFGDGMTSLESNPVHTYAGFCPDAKNGCLVTLTTCGPGGCNTTQKFLLVELSMQ